MERRQPGFCSALPLGRAFSAGAAWARKPCGSWPIFPHPKSAPDRPVFLQPFGGRLACHGSLLWPWSSAQIRPHRRRAQGFWPFRQQKAPDGRAAVLIGRDAAVADCHLRHHSRIVAKRSSPSFAQFVIIQLLPACLRLEQDHVLLPEGLTSKMIGPRPSLISRAMPMVVKWGSVFGPEYGEYLSMKFSPRRFTKRAPSGKDASGLPRAKSLGIFQTRENSRSCRSQPISKAIFMPSPVGVFLP